MAALLEWSLPSGEVMYAEFVRFADVIHVGLVVHD